jgi:acyl carrier protein
LNPSKDVIQVLERVLNLRGRTSTFNLDTPLLGSLPELDSMAVVAVITALEDRYGFTVEDDEIDGAAFASVGSLVRFVEEKLKAS